MRINKKVSNVRAKFDVWSLMYTTDTSVDSFLTAAAPLPVIQTFYSRFLTSFFFEIPLLWYWGKPASHGLRLHGNDNHFSIGFFCYQKEKYWTKLFSNVQQRLSSNSWLLQMSCTTILSVSTMGTKQTFYEFAFTFWYTMSPDKTVMLCNWYFWW